MQGEGRGGLGIMSEDVLRRIPHQILEEAQKAGRLQVRVSRLKDKLILSEDTDSGKIELKLGYPRASARPKSNVIGIKYVQFSDITARIKPKMLNV